MTGTMGASALHVARCTLRVTANAGMDITMRLRS